MHRDLKPSNLFVTEDEGRIVVLDFGLAKLFLDEVDELTCTGAMLGTPHYMAPEQCLSSRNVDPRADVFSLGAITYHLICGQVPFGAKLRGELIAMHRGEPPVPLSERVEDVPDSLNRAVMWALETDREQRCPTMGAYADALREVLKEAGKKNLPQAVGPRGTLPSGAIVQPVQPVPAPQQTSWLRWGVITLVALLVVLLLLLVGLWFLR